MLDLVFVVLCALGLPVLINKTTEAGHFHWIKPRLRPIWTAVLAFFTLYLMSKQASLEVISEMHKSSLTGLRGYPVAGSCGAALRCLFWWISGAMLDTKQVSVKATPTTDQKPGPPPTLKLLFENDWPDLPAYYHEATLESDGLQSKKADVAWRLKGDFSARSKFLAFFLESKMPPDDAYKVCQHFASNYNHFIDTANSEVDIIDKFPSDTSGTHLRDMVFSRRIFLYYENPDFSAEQKGLLEGLYNKNGLSLQFQDSAYAWLRRDDKITPRPSPLTPNRTLLQNAKTNEGLTIKVTALKAHP